MSGETPSGRLERAPTPGLGAALRDVRAARGLSLADVAGATGISKSALSLIENDKADITLGRLVRLAELYDAHLDDLLPSRGRADPVVVRRDERRRIHLREGRPGHGVDLHLLAPDRNRLMMPIVAVIEPGQGGDFARHEGEELVVVLEGTLRFELEGSEAVVLERGDCAYYESAKPHRWTSIGEGYARLLSVSTPPRW